MLSPFLFYTSSFLNSQGFNLLVSTHFYILHVYICERGRAPYKKINNREKCLLSSWKWCNAHEYQVSSPCVLPLGSLNSEEVNAWGHLLLFKYVVVMETMSYAFVPSLISSPWVLHLASLRSEECLKLFDVVQTICGRHGNMTLSWKWCNMHAYQVSSPCVLPLATLRRSAWGYLNNM